jgi:hypothetical protein
MSSGEKTFGTVCAYNLKPTSAVKGPVATRSELPEGSNLEAAHFFYFVQTKLRSVPFRHI